MIWLTIIIVLISLGAPLWLSLILFGINAFIPDAIPFADEFVQGLGIASKIKNASKVSSLINWVVNNKRLAVVCLIGTVVVAVNFL